jgi:hypothetical protein
LVATPMLVKVEIERRLLKRRVPMTGRASWTRWKSAGVVAATKVYESLPRPRFATRSSKIDKRVASVY